MYVKVETTKNEKKTMILKMPVSIVLSRLLRRKHYKSTWKSRPKHFLFNFVLISIKRQKIKK